MRYARRDLFGVPMKPVSGGYLASTMLKLCVSKEFKLLAAHESSPITEWLRALARALHAELGGKGVGAIGMCLTGNFALSMAVEPSLMAPVLSQPALPLPMGKGRRGALAVSPDELEAVKRRVAGEGLKVLGLCFTHDPKVRRVADRVVRIEDGRIAA